MRTPLRTETRSTTLGGGCAEGGCSNHIWPLEGSTTPKQFWYLISRTCFWGITIVCNIRHHCCLRTDAGLSGRQWWMMMYAVAACSAGDDLSCTGFPISVFCLWIQVWCFCVCMYVYIYFSYTSGWVLSVFGWVICLGWVEKRKKSQFHGVLIILCSFQIKISVKKKIPQIKNIHT